MNKTNHSKTGRRRNKLSNKSGRSATRMAGDVALNANIERAIVETLEGRQLMASVAAVTGLTLINADTDKVIATNLNSGTVLNLATLPTRNLSIRADMGDGQHESVRFSLDGKTIAKESTAPYAIAGNDGDDYFGWTPNLGSHTLTATPYSANGATGTAGEAKTLQFTVINDADSGRGIMTGVASVDSLSLINADTDQVITSDLLHGATIDFSKIGTRNLSIRAHLSNGSAESVKFTLDGSTTSIENIEAFAIAGNDGSDFAAWTPSTGAHTLTVTAFTADHARGEAGASKTIAFNVVGTQQSQPVPAPQPVTAPTPTPTPTPTPSPAPAPVPTDGDGDDSGEFNAPVPVITHTTGKTVNAGHAMHVQGTLSTVSVGSIQNATFEWDFGDAGSKYNTLRGFNAAHVYANSGTYTITLKITNSAGKTATKTSSVTIAAANRRVIYVSNSGSDSSNGLSQDSAIKSFAKARSMVSDNTEILFRRGDTFSTDSSMSISSDNVVFGAYGDSSNAKPVIKYSGPRGYTALFSASSSSNDVMIKGLTLDSIYSDRAITDDDRMPTGVSPKGTNLSVVDCKFMNLGYGINGNGGPQAVLAQDNDSPSDYALRGYFAWVQGSDYVFLGNTVVDVNSHVIRVGGSDRTLVAHNNFSNPVKEGASTRGTLTIHQGNYIYVHDNTLNQGKVTIGPLGEGDGLDDKGARFKYGVFDGNRINSVVIVEHGSEHVAIRNNVVSVNDGKGIEIEGFSGSYGRGVVDVTVDNNTGLNNSDNGSFICVRGNVDGITLTDNLYIAPNLITGNGAAGIRVIESNLDSFIKISGNIWPDAETLARAEGGINIVGSTVSSDTYRNPAEWDAFGEVNGDVFRNVTLGTTYQVSIGSVKAGSSLRRAA